MPIFILVFYSVMADQWPEEAFQAKWGSVLVGMDIEPHPLRYNKKLALFFPILLLVRRLTFVAAVIFTPSFLVLQFIILFGSAMANAVYLLALWPLQ